MSKLIDTTFTAKDIHTAVSVYEYIVPAGVVKVRIQVRLYQIAGGGDYTINLRLNDGDAQADDPVVPKTTYTAAAGAQNLWLATGDFDVDPGDSVNVMVLGLAGDTAVTGSIRIFDDTGTKVDLISILGTAITETAGYIAAAFSKFFNKATPTGTVNSLPDAVAGATSGLAIVGSVMGKSPATLAAADVSGNLPADLKAVTVGVDFSAVQKASITAAVPSAGAIDTQLSGTHGSGAWGVGGTGGSLAITDYPVTDATTGLPIQGATVELYPTDAYTGIIASQVSDSLGHVTFSNLTAGTYYLKIIADGYDTAYDSEVAA
jgi:hypothetical protein